MRLPSHQRAPVSRGSCCVPSWPPLLAALAHRADRRCGQARQGRRGACSSPRASAARSSPAAAGCSTARVFSGGSLVVADYSADARHEASTRRCVPTLNADGSRTYVPLRHEASGHGLPISGTLYRVTVLGSANVNAAGVYGRLQVRGQGHAERQRREARAGTARSSNSARCPRDLKKLFQLALAGAPPPATVRPLRRLRLPRRPRRPRRPWPRCGQAAERTRVRTRCVARVSA